MSDHKHSVIYNYQFDVYPEIWMGDYWQLGFVLNETQWHGMAIQEEQQFCDIRVLYIALFQRPDDRKGFDVFLNWFLRVWWHEWGHIIGLSDKHHTALWKNINTIFLD